MASLAFAPQQPASVPARVPVRPAPLPAPSLPRAVPASPGLSALEWSVVVLAERDTIASLREPGAIAAALGSLFGLRRPNRLANPELEALRRIAVYAWRKSWNVPDSEVASFLDAGFTLDQYELIQRSIHKGRTAAARRRRGA